MPQPRHLCLRNLIQYFILMESSFSNTQNLLYRQSRTARSSVRRRTSLSQYDPKDTFKLAALNSVTMGVKHNDVGYITGRDLNKLRAYDSKLADLSIVDSSNALKDIRKKYDDFKKMNVLKQKELTKLKEELEDIKGEESKYISKKTKAEDMVRQLEEALVGRKNVYEEVLMDKKSLVSLVHRMKQDKVVYDLRKFNAQKELQHAKKQLNILITEATSVGESTERSKLVYDKLVAELEAENKSRQDHLESLRLQIKSVEQSKQISSARENQIRDIAERAMQDKDDNEKNWRNLLILHKFMSRMLRDKMDREMKKFGIVEDAFTNIKIATGVGDTQQLVHKFLYKEEVYGELLSAIADIEKKIEHIKADGQELQNQQKKLKAELQLMDINKKPDTDLTKEMKELDVASDRSKKTYSKNRNLLSWIIKQLKKISKSQGKAPPNVSTVEQAVKQYFTWLDKSTDALQQNPNLVLDQTGLQLSKRDNEKLMRFKPKKIKKNTQGEEELEEEDEEIDQLAGTAAAEEEDYIENANNELIKGNEKFMKDLKKKYEALAKLRAEMSPKKKEEKAPAEKKVAVEPAD